MPKIARVDLESYFLAVLITKQTNSIDRGTLSSVTDFPYWASEYKLALIGMKKGRHEDQGIREREKLVQFCYPLDICVRVR